MFRPIIKALKGLIRVLKKNPLNKFGSKENGVFDFFHVKLQVL
jgi:hypothetical protein